MEDRESGHLFLTYETKERKRVKPFEPESWSRHFRRKHDVKFHKLASIARLSTSFRTAGTSVTYIFKLGIGTRA